MKRIVRRPLPPSRSRGPRDHGAHVVDPRRDGGELLERGARALRDDPGDRRLPDARRPEEDHRRRPVLLDREAQRRAGAEDVLLADELVERPRTDALRQRRDLPMPLRGRFAEEVAQAASMLTLHVRDGRGLRHVRILPGDAPTDYERYLNTEELLALQKGPGGVGAPRRAPLPGRRTSRPSCG